MNPLIKQPAVPSIYSIQNMRVEKSLLQNRITKWKFFNPSLSIPFLLLALSNSYYLDFSSYQIPSSHIDRKPIKGDMNGNEFGRIIFIFSIIKLRKRWLDFWMHFFLPCSPELVFTSDAPEDLYTSP